MRVAVLGPVQVTSGEREIPLAGRHQRALVAILASEAGQVISAEQLIDTLWPDRPPVAARTKLQGCVSDVRKSLGHAGLGAAGSASTHWPLTTRAPGYLLSTRDVAVDLAEYRSLTTLASDELRAGDATLASGHLATALALWRGPAFAGLTAPVFVGLAAALDRGRLLAIERKADCDLVLGRNDTVADELSTILAAHPLIERARAQLMLALYRLGCRAEALELYRAGRQILRDEVGIEPGALLRRLHELMLADDPRLHAADILARIRNTASTVSMSVANPEPEGRMAAGA